MEFTEAKLGRIFILRLHQGEVLHEVVEKFASEKHVSSALCFFLGGAEDKSKVVVGPKDGTAMPPEPMVTLLKASMKPAAWEQSSPMNRENRNCTCTQALGEMTLRSRAACAWVLMFGR